MPLEIWIPRSAEEQQAGFICRLCKQRESTAQQLASHVARHFKDDEAGIRMMSPRERAPGLLGDNNVDTEFEDWHSRRRTDA